MNKSEELGEELKKNIAEEEKKKKDEERKEKAKNGGKKRNEKEEKKKTEKEEKIEQYVWLFLALSVLGLFWFFIGSFAGKFWFKVFLSAVVSFVIGIKPKTWLWRILTGITVFFVSMIYTGETTELFQYAIIATGGSALLLFGLEEFVIKKNIYPRGMLPVFLITVVICVGSLLGDLFRDHREIINEQKVSVFDLQKEIETGNELTKRFSFSNKKIKIPESYFPIIILEKEKKSILQLAQNWLVLKIKNCLPAEYGRANSVIRMALFIIFLFIVHAVFVPIGSLEAAKDYWKLREEKMKKAGVKQEPKTQADLFSIYGIIEAIKDAGDFISKLHIRRRKK